MNNKPNNMFPIDLASKIALVKPTDSKGATVQTSTFRTLGQPAQMRVVMPSGTSSGGAAQIIQTHLMPLPHVIKQVDGGGVRTQITALPSTARTLSQTSITVTRSPTPNTFVQRGPTSVANLGPRGVSMSAPIRAPTPPSSTAINNITSSFVRGPMPGRAPSPAGSTILSPGTTWMTSGSPPVQLIRASIGPSPRGRVPASSTSNNTTIVSSQPQPQQSQQQIVTAQQPQQTYVATLSTVMPPRQQTATLIYSNVTNPQQQFTAVPNQRLAVATPLITQRQVRPIQLNNARLATTAVRVSTSNLSIRGPTIPVLNQANVLSVNTMQGRPAGVTATNLTTSGPTTRIIQVQQPQQGGAPGQVSRNSLNLMTLHPVMMNSATATTGRQATTAKVQPSLTITHVNKLTTAGTTSGTVQVSQQTTQGGSALTQSGPQQIQLQGGGGGPIGIVTSGTHSTMQGGVQHQQPSHQLAQIVGLNQASGHQIQIIGGPNIPVSGTVVPLTITSRGGGPPGTITATTTQIVRNISAANAITTTTVLPIAKVLPQPQSVADLVQQQQQPPIQVVASTNLVQQQQQQQNVFLHTRSPNPSSVTSSVAPTTFLQTPSTFYYEPSSTMSASTGGSVLSMNTSASVSSLSSLSGVSNVSMSNAAAAASMPSTTGGPSTTSVSYAPVSINSSFAVVPPSNRVSGAPTLQGMIPQTSANGQSNINALPVRFNPQLLVDNAQHQLLQSHNGNTQQQHVQSMQQAISGNAHHIITMQPNAAPSAMTSRAASDATSANATMLVPMSAKVAATLANVSSGVVTSMATSVTMSPRSNVVRKRDSEGIPKSAVKNLGPTLSQMSGPVTQNNHSANNLPPGIILNAGGMILEKNLMRDRMVSPVSRAESSDGSTTVSATSSPGVDQQEEREHTGPMNRRIPELAYKAVEDLYKTQQSQQMLQVVPAAAVPHPQINIISKSSSGASQHAISSAVSTDSVSAQFQQQHSTTSSSSNGNGVEEGASPRKKPRKQNMNEHSNAVKKFAPIDQQSAYSSDASKGTQHVRSNKENSKPPTEVYIKKPRSCTLLEGYKQTWKAANNHFQRYSDVKPREERPPTVMDLANQTCVLQKVNGWKIHHLNAQMEDLAEVETQVYDKLAKMLQRMEVQKQSPEVDRVNELIKGNMQRSKIVSEGIGDARGQIMKIFDHKSHVADIIQRCASKRNFKKREKAI